MPPIAEKIRTGVLSTFGIGGLKMTFAITRQILVQSTTSLHRLQQGGANTRVLFRVCAASARQFSTVSPDEGNVGSSLSRLKAIAKNNKVAIGGSLLLLVGSTIVVHNLINVKGNENRPDNGSAGTQGPNSPATVQGAGSAQANGANSPAIAQTAHTINNNPVIKNPFEKKTAQ